MFSSEMKNLFTTIIILLTLAVLLTVAQQRYDDQTPVDDINENERTSNDDNEDIPVVEGDGGNVEIKVEEDVHVLTSDNFDIIVNSRPIILVEFYAQWCGHCQSLAPEYAKAAKILKEDTPQIPLAKVDATVEEQLAQKYGVQGFPTLLLFRNGVKLEYDGPRTAQGIVDYMREKADPDWKPPPESVLTLTDSDFDTVVNGEDLMLVEFYAPWCGHCKQLAPEYERAAKQLLLSSPPIKLAKVVATEQTELAKRFDVTGYPTLFIFRRGKHYKYDGPREERGIVEYMKRQQDSPSKLVSSVDQLKKLLSPEWPTIVGFFSGDNSRQFEVFIDAGYKERDRGFSFLHITDKLVADSLKESADTVVLFQAKRFESKYEPNRYRFPIDQLTLPEDISHFIGNNSLPLVGERSHNTQWLYSDKYPLVVVYYDVDFSFEHRKQTQLIREQIVKVANKYKGVITFAISKEDSYVDELKLLQLEDSGEDVNVGYFSSLSIRYAMPPTDDFDAESLEQFVSDVRSGKAKRAIKSQPIAVRNWQSGPLVTVVGDSFDDIVTNSKKHVLIEFYAPWCGHCQQLEPIYQKLAEKFKYSKDSLVITKMDATANDYPIDVFKVDGFPTIYFVDRINKAKPLLYIGDRSFDDLVKFVDSQLELDFQRKQEL